MSSKGAVFAAIAATMGNMLQGWDNATIAGALIYIKREFHLETQPTVEGLIVAMSLIGATCITLFSGHVSDLLGRKLMLIISSVFYFLGGLVMFWAPNVWVLLIGRLLDGFGVGLAVTLIPIYISETAPPEIRGQLNTLPQFTGSGGMFLSYCMVFAMTLSESPSWRLMLGVLSFPSILYFVLTVFYLPESPRWLVSKGRMDDARRVLQQLRGKEDVNGEMALLVEGLGTGADTSIEEYVIGPGNDEDATTDNKDKIRLYGAEQGQSWIAKPVTAQSMLGSMASRCVPNTPRGQETMAPQGSMANMMDPLVNLFGSVHERIPQSGKAGGGSIFPNFGSMFNAGDEQQGKPDNWDVGSRSSSDGGDGDYDDNMRSPLLSWDDSGGDKDAMPQSSFMGGNNSLFQSGTGELCNTQGIGGGWQLAYKRGEKRGPNGKGELKRVYLHQDAGVGSTPRGRGGSVLSFHQGDVPEESEFVQAAGLVGQSALNLKHVKGESPFGEAAVQPSASATKGLSWRELFEPGVKHALMVGMGIQILQQFSGINGVMYYTPQILSQAGVDVLLSSIGVSGDSASILISALTTLLMLPSIGLAMKLMDISGRRYLLLNTLPILLTTLIILVVSNVVHMGNIIHATLSTISVIVYFCSFVMGFGPIPNILCSEIFPTRVRGLCIALCSLTFWICDIIVTYSLPGLLSSIGLAGVFGIYGVVCAISWFFVYLKVPETKGMPLEVISEFFNVGARQA